MTSNLHGRPDVSILIVSYNTRELNLACLRSVVRETRDLDYEIIVVDNASVDGSADAIAHEFSAVQLVRSRENLGFAGGVNRAATLAQGEFLLLLNPDTEVLDGAIQRLVALARENPEAGIYGGRTVFADGSLNPSCCWRRITAWGLLSRALGLSMLLENSAWLNPEGYGGWRRDTPREVDIVQGSFLLLRAATWQELGGFSKEFFMYGEEADLCLRARARGYRPRFFPSASIVHHGGGSEPVKADKQIRLLSAKRLLIQRHWDARTAWLGLSLLRLAPRLRALAVAVASAVGVDPGAGAVWREVWNRRGEWDTDQPTWALPVKPLPQSDR
jgi:GT2 family glycosyltransferase